MIYISFFLHKLKTNLLLSAAVTFRMELRCVIAVIRHGDRTPKQKMKMEVRHQRYQHFTSTVSNDLHHELSLTPAEYEVHGDGMLS